MIPLWKLIVIQVIKKCVFNGALRLTAVFKRAYYETLSSATCVHPHTLLL